MMLVGRVPRGVRIGFVLLVSVAVVLAIFALVDRIYIAYFFDPSTIVIPSYISMGVGAVMYVWGYLVIVGPRGSKPEAGRGQKLYLLIAAIAITIDAALILQGLSMTDYFAG